MLEVNTWGLGLEVVLLGLVRFPKVAEFNCRFVYKLFRWSATQTLISSLWKQVT